MNAAPRLSKESAISLAVRLTPEYAMVLRELQSHQFEFEPRIASIRDRLGNYVLLYESEFRLGAALAIGLLGDEKFRSLGERGKGLSLQEQIEFLEALAKDVADEDAFRLPESEQEWQEAEALVNEMPTQERDRIVRQAQFFFSGMFGGFFNTLSLMVHGAKLTSLVPQAVKGDDGSLLKAVQIDRYLLTHHPYFRERKLRAQERCKIEEREAEFLARLFYRERNSAVRGRIRYPGLYMLFGILESCGWLHDMTHEEILDVCDTAGLERYQNRVDDVGAVTKRLREYRRWQRTGTVSMH